MFSYMSLVRRRLPIFDIRLLGTRTMHLENRILRQFEMRRMGTVEDTFSSEIWVLFIGVTSDVIRRRNVRAYVRAQIGCEYFHPINGASAAKYKRTLRISRRRRAALWLKCQRLRCLLCCGVQRVGRQSVKST